MKALKKILLLSVGGFLFLGGLGVDRISISFFGALIATLLVTVYTLLSKRVYFPKGFLAYILFIISASFGVFWSIDAETTFPYLVLFITGGLFWLLFYNLKGVSKKLLYFTILLGWLFALLYIYYVLKKDIYISGLSLVMPSVDSLNHHHLGDFWAIVLVISFGLFFQKIKTVGKVVLTITILFGFYILIISYSRSAYLAFFVGMAYLWQRNLKSIANLNKPFLVVGIVALILFLLTAVFKTTLFSRGYFLQAIVGTIKNPLGLGLGNFWYISQDATYRFFGFKDYSSYTLNFLLEVLIGQGIFSIFFFIWFWQVARNIFIHGTREKLISRAVILALFVNFFFDYTYFIPTMLWLCFINLGIVQQKN